jgi:type IV pilus assembly protein PilX
MTHRTPSGPPRAQRGAVLFVALILLLVLTMIGVTAARMQTGEVMMARNEHNHQLAMQSAEAALRSAESSLWAGKYSDADFANNANGLYQLQSEVAGNGGTSFADTVNWSQPGGVTQTYAGPSLSSAPAAQQPAQIIIEDLPPVARPGDPICSSSYGQEQVCSVYRVTAHATGGDLSANATLQSIFH